MYKSIIYSILLSLLAFVMTGCKEIEMQSTTRTSDINIDGQMNEWEGKLLYLDEPGLALGFQHDDENLYMCITSRDRMLIGKMLMAGITIWFNPDDGKGKIVGITYPVHAQGEMNQMRQQMDMKAGEMNQPPQTDKILQQLQDQREFLLINEDNYPLGYYPIDGSEGYKIKIGMNKENMVYEMKVPLITSGLSQPVTISDENTILISFESVEMKKPERSGSPSGLGEPGGGMGGNNPGGMGGGRPGGREGGPGGMPGNMKEANESLDFSVLLKLIK